MTPDGVLIIVVAVSGMLLGLCGIWVLVEGMTLDDEDDQRIWRDGDD